MIKNFLFKRALFIFRRDLRLEDNTGLIFALQNAKEVIASFIFTPEQIENNPYKSTHCLQFMMESLEDLQKNLEGKLHFFYGNPEDIVNQCIAKLCLDSVVVNRDYTPYSINRDRKIEAVCKKNGVSYHAFDDALLHSPEEILKADGTPYKVFTPFFKQSLQHQVNEQFRCSYKNYYSKPISFSCSKKRIQSIYPKAMSQQKGGRSEALKILKNMPMYSQYNLHRDFPAIEGTTHLSAHLKFTTVSPREVYRVLIKEKNKELIRSLYWRDFFTSIGYHFPHIFQGSFHQKYDKLKWSANEEHFQRWCLGETGFPIVDAGMREMRQTGFMHNRVRMIAASFLVKDLHIDWRWGERYFAQTLIDYDPCVNNGNWQWVAGTGCDAQPYFRIFNPWSQQKKFDPHCIYIKRWVPELSSLPNQMIHNETLGLPMVDHTREAKRALMGL